MTNHESRRRGASRVTKFLASLGALAFVAGAPALAQDKPESINSGIQLVTATDIVAKQRGWAEDLIGVPIEWNTFDSGKDAILGLGAGGVDWSLTGSAPAAFGLSSGVEGEIIWIFHLLGANEALVVEPDSGIESVAELKGKKVAVPFGTTTHFDMLKALELADMTQQDVELLDMSPQDMAAAFERGDIDAGWVWFPVLARLLDAGGEPITDALDMAEAGFPTADVLTLNPEFGDQYPDVVARYIAALHCGVEMGNADVGHIVEDIVEEFGLEADAAEQALTTVKRLTAEEQTSEKWMGTPGNPGALAESIWQQATFLRDQDITDNAYELEYYQERVNPEYLQMAIDKGYTEQCDQLADWPL